jgi:hypothetical protein
MQKSTPFEDTSRDPGVADGDANSLAEIPAWGERRWVVLVFERVREKDEQGNWCTREFGLCIVDPKTGGAASLYDPETWADNSRANNYACLANIDSSDEFGRWPAYVDGEECVRWPDGTVAERRPR